MVDTLKEEGSGNKISFIMTLLKLTISTSAYQILALTLNLKATVVHTGAELLQRIRTLLVGSAPVAEGDRNKYAGIKFKGSEPLQEYASKKLLAGYNCRKNPCDIMEDFISGITTPEYYQHALILTTAEDYRRQKARVEILSLSADYASCFREAATLVSHFARNLEELLLKIKARGGPPNPKGGKPSINALEPGACTLCLRHHHPSQECVTCSRCRGKGHLASECKQQTDDTRTKSFCQKCKRNTYHTTEEHRDKRQQGPPLPPTSGTKAGDNPPKTEPNPSTNPTKGQPPGRG